MLQATPKLRLKTTIYYYSWFSGLSGIIWADLFFKGKRNHSYSCIKLAGTRISKKTSSSSPSTQDLYPYGLSSLRNLVSFFSSSQLDSKKCIPRDQAPVCKRLPSLSNTLANASLAREYHMVRIGVNVRGPLKGVNTMSCVSLWATWHSQKQ